MKITAWTWYRMGINYRTLARKAREAGNMEMWAEYFAKGDDCFMKAKGHA